MPSARCRLARLVSIPGWRARSQSSKASISFPSTGPRLSRAPRLDEAVSGERARAQASLDPGSTVRATMAARARSRMRPGLRCRMRRMPSFRQTPRTAAAWPCGQALLMVTASWRRVKTTPPWSMASMASMRNRGSLERLATVRLRILFPSRQVSRTRTEGGEVRLGMTWTLSDMAGFRLATTCLIQDTVSEDCCQHEICNYMATKSRTGVPRRAKTRSQFNGLHPMFMICTGMKFRLGRSSFDRQSLLLDPAERPDFAGHAS